LNPPLLPTTGETCAVRNPGRISTRREKGGRMRATELRVQSASREAQFAFCSVVLRGPPFFLRVETLRTSHLHGRRDARPRVNRFRSHADAIQAIVLQPGSCCPTHRTGTGCRAATIPHATQACSYSAKARQTAGLGPSNGSPRRYGNSRDQVQTHADSFCITASGMSKFA
jgi:hypothetical protein